MDAGWRIDRSGASDAIERGDADARLLSAGLRGVAASLDDIAGLLDDGVGPAVRRFEARWRASAESVDRRTTAAVEGARAVMREHLLADDTMADVFGSGLLETESLGNRFSPRIKQ